MANGYYTHMLVESAQEASVFSDEYTWTILEVLRSAGAKGLTAEQVHQRVEKEIGSSVSRSKIYSLLKRLYENEWTHKYYDDKLQAWRHTISLMWGGFDVKDEFYDSVKSTLKNHMTQTLFPALSEFIKKALNEFENDPSISKWLPSDRPDDLCRKCKTSHEAEEFIDALLDIGCNEFVQSDKFRDFMRKSKFATDTDD